MYGELLTACPTASKPKLVAVFQKLIHTPAVLCGAIDKHIEETQTKQQGTRGQEQTLDELDRERAKTDKLQLEIEDVARQLHEKNKEAVKAKTSALLEAKKDNEGGTED
jgi:hypothetical protein